MREKSAVRILVFAVAVLFAANTFADCLPCKEEIDNGMGVLGARLYAETVANTGVRPIDALVGRFYADGVETIFSPLAKKFLAGDHGHLSDDQIKRLMEQIDKQCYRADDFTAWALMSDTAIVEHAPEWTTKILKWAKDDQTFYTKLSAELRD